jgi:hypothetical protein
MRTRKSITVETIRRLHAVSRERMPNEENAAIHEQLHRMAAVLFGADSLAGLSEAQAGLLRQMLLGQRSIEASPRRKELVGKLDQMIALAPDSDDLRDHVRRIAAERFGNAPDPMTGEDWPDCGIGRLSALIRVASYYLRKGA